jgi:hypothetical protein
VVELEDETYSETITYAHELEVQGDATNATIADPSVLF